MRYFEIVTPYGTFYRRVDKSNDPMIPLEQLPLSGFIVRGNKVINVEAELVRRGLID